MSSAPVHTFFPVGCSLQALAGAGTACSWLGGLDLVMPQPALPYLVGAGPGCLPLAPGDAEGSAAEGRKLLPLPASHHFAA